jgi:hypothetical protein
MTTQPAASSPAVRLSGPSGAVWLDGDALLLDQNDTRTRIPLEAIEAVHVEGPDRRSVAVVLTSPDGSPGTVYRLDSRNSEASVATFADVVSRALPPRSTASRQDGKKLVQVTSNIDPRARTRPDRKPLWIWGGSFAAFYLGVLLIMFVSGESGWALAWGVIGLVLPPMCLVLLGIAVSEIRKSRILRRRGITVMVSLAGGYEYARSQEFPFTDVEGRTRTLRLDRDDYREAKRVSGNKVEVTYDPLDPERNAIAMTGTRRMTIIMTALIGSVLMAVALLPIVGFLVTVLS